MKILFLTDGIHPFQLGGMQKHSLILSRLLAEREVWMHLYHIGGKDYSQEAFKSQYGAEISFITEKVIEWPQVGKLPGHYIKENKKYSQLIYNDVKERIHEFDLIYAQGFTGWYFAKLKLKGRLHVPLLSNFHGLNMLQPVSGLKAKLQNKLMLGSVKDIFNGSDYVFSFGGKISKYLKEFGVSESKILLQSNGVEASWLVNKSSNEIRNQKRTVSFIGRNDAVKGLKELNSALNELIKRKDLSFKFNFIGPIPKEIQIKDERIAYFGELRDSEKIKEILRQSDVLICPSHSEGMPTVILEGMACGLAIIATDVGAISRMIKDNGILIDSPDPELIKKAIMELIEMSVKDLNAMKVQSIELVKKNFLWDVVADKKLTQLRRIISTK